MTSCILHDVVFAIVAWVLWYQNMSCMVMIETMQSK